MATDESLARLEEFNALLARTLGEIQEGTTDIENEGRALDDAADDAAQKIGALEQQLSDWLDQLGSSGEEAASQLRDLSQVAADGAEDRLGDADERLDATAAAAAERVDAGQETLETGFADLREQGFGTLATTLDELESQSEELDGEIAEDFEQLESAVDETRERMVAAGQEAADQLGEAQQEAGQHETEVTEAASELTAGVEEQRGAAEGDAEDAGDGLGTTYESWAGEAVSAAEEYVAALESAFADVAEALGAAGEELAQAVDQAREQSLPARDSDLAASGSVLEAGEALVGGLEPIVDGLEVSLRVVDQISQLLRELG